MKSLIDILDLSNQPNIIEENMKRIDRGHFEHEGYDIYNLEHPKLYGKWEIYRKDDFIIRALNLKDAEKIIDGRIEVLKRNNSLK